MVLASILGLVVGAICQCEKNKTTATKKSHPFLNNYMEKC